MSAKNRRKPAQDDGCPPAHSVVLNALDRAASLIRHRSSEVLNEVRRFGQVNHVLELLMDLEAIRRELALAAKRVPDVVVEARR